MSLDELFISRFHSLSGVTISERKKNFAKLLQENDSLKNDPDMLKLISTKLTPKNHLEHLLKLEFQIYFKIVKELYYHMEQGKNAVFVCKILKQDWFFEAWCKDIVSRGAKDFVNIVLPHMSFSVRMKVVMKISKHMDEKNFDHIFDHLIMKFGASTASRFITGCSACKIREFMDNANYLKITEQLKATQLQKIYLKDPSSIDLYFDKIQFPNSILMARYYLHDKSFIKHDKDSRKIYYNKYVKLQSLLRFVLNKNCQHFSDLIKRHNNFTHIKWGRRGTKKIVALERDEIIRNPHKYLDFNLPALFSKLGKDSKLMFINTFPVKMRDLLDKNEYERSATFRRLIKRYPKKYRGDLYFKTIQEHYNDQIVNYPQFIDEDLLSVVQDKSMRAQLAKVAVDNDPHQCPKYFDNAIEYYKGHIISCIYDTEEKGIYLVNAVRACCIDKNKDVHKLAQLMKFIYDNHRTLQGCHTFFDTVDRLFCGKDFSPEVWHYYTKIMIEKARDSEPDQQISTLIDVRSVSTSRKMEYLEFLFTNNIQNIDDLLLKIKTIWSINFCNFNRDFAKHCLTILGSHQPVIDDLLPNVRHCDFETILAMEAYNAKYNTEELRFRDFPRLLERFTESGGSSDNWYYRSRLYKPMIFTTRPNQFREESLQLYWDNARKNILGKDLTWFLKYEPVQIAQNLSRCLESLVKYGNRKMWSCIKCYSHLSLDQELVSYCKEKLAVEITGATIRKKVVAKNRYIDCLSWVLSPEKFRAYAERSKPKLDKIIFDPFGCFELSGSKQGIRFVLRCSIANYCKNTRCYELLPALLHYYGHPNYKKYALTSFCSLSARTSEHLLEEFLNSPLLVSNKVKKQALFLTCEFSSIDSVERMITKWFHNEDDKSLSFQVAMKYFLKNPGDRSFGLVKLTMEHEINYLRGCWVSMHCVLKYLNIMPVEYQVKYAVAIWEYLNTDSDTEEANKRRCKNIVLDNLLQCSTNGDSLLSHLPLDFGLQFMQYFGDLSDDQVLKFVFNFMVQQRTQSAIIVLDAILNEMDKLESDRRICYFNSFYPYIVKSKGQDLSFLDRYVEYWTDKLDPIDSFTEHIDLFFIKLKISLIPEDVPDKFCEQIVEYLSALINRYGQFVLSIFRKELQDVWTNFMDGRTSPCRCCYHLVTKHPSRFVFMLVAELLRANNLGSGTREEEEKDWAKKTLEVLWSVADEDVRIFARVNLVSLSSDLKRRLPMSLDILLG